MPEASRWIIVTGEGYRFLVAQQANETEIQVGSILLEPVPPNTAPSIALAAFEALANHQSPKLLVQTADHYIQDLEAFGRVVREAFDSEAPFVLFGIKPTRPETRYGYIECGAEESSAFIVKSFKEKPDLPTAESYLDTGNYLWNSGMFMLDAEAYLKAYDDVRSAKRSLDEYFRFHNSERRHQSLNDQTPDRVYNQPTARLAA